MSLIPQKGHIAIVADVPSVSAWIDAKPSSKGSYMKTFVQRDALVVEYKPRQGIYSQITLVRPVQEFIGLFLINLSAAKCGRRFARSDLA